MPRVVLAVMFFVSTADAQPPRRGPHWVQEQLHHEHASVPPPLMMFASPEDECPGATLLRACGQEVPSTCPDLHTVMSAAGELCRAELMRQTLAPGMREAAIEVLAHALVGNRDGVVDLAADETFISVSRLPEMPGASDIAWRALDLMVYVALYQEALESLDTYQARWPESRGRQRDEMRARLLHLNRQHDDMLVHLRAVVRRCENAECRNHFRVLLRQALVEGLRTCRDPSVDRGRLRRCMHNALEAEELSGRRTPRSQQADIAATIQWAARELQNSTGAPAPPMQTVRPEAGRGDIDRSLWASWRCDSGRTTRRHAWRHHAWPSESRASLHGSGRAAPACWTFHGGTGRRRRCGRNHRLRSALAINAETPPAVRHLRSPLARETNEDRRRTWR